MRIRPLILAMAAAPLLATPLSNASEPAPTKPKALSGADWQKAARQQAEKEAASPRSAAAIERTRNSDAETAPSDSVEVFGIDDGRPKRGESQRRDGGAITWIDGDCFYAAPTPMFDPGAATRLWLPTCKPGSPRALGVGRNAKAPRPVIDSGAEPKALVRPVVERDTLPQEPGASRTTTEGPR